MKATIQQIKEVRQIPGNEKIEIVEIKGRSAVVKQGHFKQGDLCVYVETPNPSPDGYFSTRVRVMPISILEDEDEMKIGISKQPWGDQLQLGPYDNALVIEEGTEVTKVLNLTKFI